MDNNVREAKTKEAVPTFSETASEYFYTLRQNFISSSWESKK